MRILRFILLQGFLCLGALYPVKDIWGTVEEQRQYVNDILRLSGEGLSSEEIVIALDVAEYIDSLSVDTDEEHAAEDL